MLSKLCNSDPGNAPLSPSQKSFKSSRRSHATWRYSSLSPSFFWQHVLPSRPLFASRQLGPWSRGSSQWLWVLLCSCSSSWAPRLQVNLRFLLKKQLRHCSKLHTLWSTRQLHNMHFRKQPLFRPRFRPRWFNYTSDATPLHTGHSAFQMIRFLTSHRVGNSDAIVHHHLPSFS